MQPIRGIHVEATDPIQPVIIQNVWIKDGVRLVLGPGDFTVADCSFVYDDDPEI